MNDPNFYINDVESLNTTHSKTSFQRIDKFKKSSFNEFAY